MQLLPSFGACHGWRAWILIARRTTRWRLKPLLFIYLLGTDFATWHMPRPANLDLDSAADNTMTVEAITVHLFSLCEFCRQRMPQPLGSDHNCSRRYNNVWTVYYLQFSRNAFNHCACSISVFFQLTYCICCITCTQGCFATLIIWLLLCLVHIPVEWRSDMKASTVLYCL